MSYGPDLLDYFRRATGYGDKILHGAKPADLPVEQPTRFKQVIKVPTHDHKCRDGPKPELGIPPLLSATMFGPLARLAEHTVVIHV
ncbi:hypothetical protein [Bradyrhizobium sp.]|uniref:hypothetical protein n=1 Tax=Bradyrhizobium sp. TaxID=376 RepID=UPI003BAE8732